MKKIMLCTSAMLLGTLALENINVEGMKEDPKPNNKIARYSMMVVSKYFDNINDYINIEKCCKEYNGLMEQFKYNPIPFQNAKERELFKNIETYHFYGKNDKKNWTKEDTRIKKFIHWGKQVSYSFWKEYKKGNRAFTNVEYGKEDMEKYLFDRCEEEDNKVFLKEENVELEEGITSIRDWCFDACVNLKSINIPSTVSSIGFECFLGCSNLSTIKIPSNVKFFGNNYLANCGSLTSIEFQEGFKKIEKGYLGDCSTFKEIHIPESVKALGDNCFYKCGNLTSIKIPSGVSYIGKKCFDSCSNLSTINIPTSVSYIGKQCFSKCTSLTSITLPTLFTSLTKLDFIGISNDDCLVNGTKLSAIE